MKVLVKNNRLSLEGKAQSELTNLSKVPEKRLQELARKFQIGTQSLIKQTVQRTRDGKIHDEEVLTYQNKPREILEEDIRKALTITFDIPKEYWTTAQEHTWTTSGAEDMKEVADERRVKEEAGILTELKPFEEGLDSLNTIKRLVELTEDQWEYFKSVYNWHDKETDERDEGGRIIRERVYPQRIAIHEYIPENDEDLERLRKLPKRKATERSLEKYDKVKSK